MLIATVKFQVIKETEFTPFDSYDMSLGLVKSDLNPARAIIFLIWILIFMLLRSPCKDLKPYDNPFWDFSNGGKIKKKINLPKIVAYLSCSAGRTHFARTNYDYRNAQVPEIASKYEFA